MNQGVSRSIYPFGDQPFALNMETYQVDCTLNKDVRALENAIHQQWQDKGLVILKNTGMQHLSELQRWGEIIFQDFTAYKGGSAPRDKWSEKVFGLDDAPSEIDLCFHNEGCYLPAYPRCFVIGAVKAPLEGGFTLVSDNEVATDTLLNTSIGQALQEKGMRYIRLMNDKNAKDVLGYKSWQDTFYTEDRDNVEEAVKENGWDYEWLPNGTLKTSYVVDAYEYHEKLDRSLYFAGLASHATFFDQWPPYNTLPDDERPLNMTLGDGTPFTHQEIEQLYGAYNTASLPLDWKHADLAILDNLRWTHARPAFSLKTGEERIMGVTMGMMKQRVGNRF